MYKQMIVIRKDLNMSVGKTIAQACHASLGTYKKVKKSKIQRWNLDGQKKVVLEVNSKRQLLDLYNRVKRKKIPCFLVEDAGLTELEPGTITALGIGPVDEKEINKITGSMKLL